MDFLYSHTDRQTKYKHISLMLIFSLIIHALFVWLIPFGQAMEKSSTPIRISLVPQQRERIVPPSDIEEAKVQPETKQKSEKNIIVEKETVQRGMPAPLTPPIPQQQQQASQQQSTAVIAKKQAVSKQTPSLRLDTSKLETAFLKEQVNTTEQKSEDLSKSSKEEIRKIARSMENRQSYSPFRQSFSFKPGNPDFLPDIPDGTITQLNAKADQYAVFVRRVGLQVFGLLRTYSWQQLTRGEAFQIQSSSMIKVIMDAKGDLLSAELLDSSGSRTFDSVSLRSTKEGAWDKNPPAGAFASDGKIHFIFSMQTWSRLSPSSNNAEERWIRMQIGLL